MDSYKYCKHPLKSKYLSSENVNGKSNILFFMMIGVTGHIIGGAVKK